ncbi:uncharacterized protein CLUP02_01061 [Colletotrichum lupini]|uniref:Small EDRK-rich factor-like N-terminal domain-containing protein n=1 Tax=Colletotrichum lupini TaxID=145971 RepID=A0A9Q8SCC0_9PEZI|nr:uncharacterized protein CLUP02_01061 [Colletotrichum lupini]UQC74410.1 hypothetical protein CLUP02_01061 [Colletotrichum lupini]
MTRGNQRDKAREAAQKKAASQKKGNSMSGTEMQRAKESAAEIMRQKQANVTFTSSSPSRCGLEGALPGLMESLTLGQSLSVVRAVMGNGDQGGKDRSQEGSRGSRRVEKEIEAAGRQEQEQRSMEFLNYSVNCRERSMTNRERAAVSLASTGRLVSLESNQALGPNATSKILPDKHTNDRCTDTGLSPGQNFPWIDQASQTSTRVDSDVTHGRHGYLIDFHTPFRSFLSGLSLVFHRRLSGTLTDDQTGLTSRVTSRIRNSPEPVLQVAGHFLRRWLSPLPSHPESL